MYYRISTALFFLSILSAMANAQDASSAIAVSRTPLLPPVTKSADVRSVKWGQKQPAILKIEQAKPARQLPKVLVYTAQLGGQPCAISYLFTGKNDTLANVAYMIKRKTTKADTLDAIFYALTDELTKLYGKGDNIYGKNEPLTSQEINNLRSVKTPDGGAMAIIDENDLKDLSAALKDPKRKDDPEVRKRLLAMARNMPSICYAKYMAWRAKRTAVRLDMEMSTDGTCWVILLYTSVESTGNAASVNDRARPFSYSAMDRIKDLVMSQSGEYAAREN